MRRDKTRTESSPGAAADPAPASLAKGAAPGASAKGAAALDRRRFMGALGAAAVPLGIAGSALAASQGTGSAGLGARAPARERGAEPLPAAGTSGPAAPLEHGTPHHLPQLFRLESDILDVEVEGTLPADLEGAFYRVGPDPMYPLHPGDIPFDGEGHISMFHFESGRVSYRSRFARTQRYKAQAAAHRILFPMYRNPYMNDPSVKGLSRGTANTHIYFHNHLLLALKEDSPPVAMNPLTLETVDDYHTFNGQLESQTFTAHPKRDSESGNMVAFGYEARGFGSNDVNVFEYTADGRRLWNAWIKVPYVGMIHDFAVTRHYVVFYVIPLAFDAAQMRRGGIHWSWDGTKPTYFGFLRRGGDGRDLRWIKGPTRSSTHVMGTFEDRSHLHIDVEMSQFNPFPFMPFRDGTRWDPVRGASHITRLSVELGRKSVRAYGIEQLYPHQGALPRQDDRYNTVPYRIGFLPCPDPEPPSGERPRSCYARFDHATHSAMLYRSEAGTSLAEACFAPKNARAREGEGYLLGVATRMNEDRRADLVVLDAEHIDEGPIAVVKLPTRIVGQIHGYWVPKAALMGV
ncbi:MAG: carotenoid oxygenase family protein [Steroidobacteraceae bacterium]